MNKNFNFKKILTKLHSFFHYAMSVHLIFAYFVYSPTSFAKLLAIYPYYAPFFLIWLIIKLIKKYKHKFKNNK